MLELLGMFCAGVFLLVWAAILGSLVWDYITGKKDPE
jgi:hypothetical protein